MNEHELVYEALQNTLNRQVKEVHDQRNQAAKILRLYLAASALIVAALATLVSQSVLMPFEIYISDGRISSQLVTLIGILFVLRGVILFYRGFFSALEVLAPKSVYRHHWLRLFRLIFSVVRGFTFPERETYPISLGPDFDGVLADEEPSAALIQEYTSIIKGNENTLSSNNENLIRVYDRMAGGITGVGIGIVLLILAL